MLTLGVGAIDWMETNLANPDGKGGPLRLTREQKVFLLRFYEIAADGRRRYRRALLSRGKGWGRSPFSAAICAVEALGPVRFDRLDDGVPIGQPWRQERRVLVQLAAASESQTRNAWTSLQDMIVDGPAGSIPGVIVGSTRIDLPDRGRIEYVTASASSKEGARPVFVLLDQTESWTKRNGGEKLAAVIRRNLGKTDGTSVETPNSYRPGGGSVSEASFRYADDIAKGLAFDDGLLVDDRQAPSVFELDEYVTDAQVIDALRAVYGCSAAAPYDCGHEDCPPGWVDLTRLTRECRDLDTAPEDAAQFYLNRPTSPPGTFVTSAAFRAATFNSRETSP